MSVKRSWHLSDLGLLGTERSDDGQVPGGGGVAQGAVATLRRGLHTGAELQQQRRRLGVAQVGVDTQDGRVTQNLRTVVHISPAMNQQARYLQQRERDRESGEGEQSIREEPGAADGGRERSRV